MIHHGFLGAPLNCDALPAHSSHSRTDATDLMYLHESDPYQVAGSDVVRRRQKCSGKPRPHHHLSRRTMAQYVALLQPTDSIHGLFASITGDEESYGSHASIVEVFMADCSDTRWLQRTTRMPTAGGGDVARVAMIPMVVMVPVVASELSLKSSWPQWHGRLSRRFRRQLT